MKDFTIPNGTTALAALALLLAVSTALVPNGGRASASPPWAAPGPAGAGYDLSWWTVDGGGVGAGSPSPYSLAGTAGQPDAATLTGGGYTLAGGFWGGAAAPQHRIYLPVVLKDFS